MVNDNSRSSAFGLRSLARIIHNERVNVRHRAKRRFGKAVGGKRKSLTGQPFQIAMLSQMNDCVCAEDSAEPDIECQIAVWRHQSGIVIGRLWIDVVASRGLNADDHVAELLER